MVVEDGNCWRPLPGQADGDASADPTGDAGFAHLAVCLCPGYLTGPFEGFSGSGSCSPGFHNALHSSGYPPLRRDNPILFTRDGPGRFFMPS